MEIQYFLLKHLKTSDFRLSEELKPTEIDAYLPGRNFSKPENCLFYSCIMAGVVDEGEDEVEAVNS